jgi:hypothetical protein
MWAILFWWFCHSRVVRGVEGVVPPGEPHVVGGGSRPAAGGVTRAQRIWVSTNLRALLETCRCLDPGGP